MLERIAPHLAMIGIHKNGTWAAQKIIECVQSPDEVALITQNLRPYVPPLLLDQFGNYVVQSVNSLFLFNSLLRHSSQMLSSLWWPSYRLPIRGHGRSSLGDCPGPLWGP